jgi:ankyrin repeat protein
MEAYHDEDFVTFQALLDQGADPNEKFGEDQTTALHKILSVECCRLLVLAKAELNVKDKHGNTPLDTMMINYAGNMYAREQVEFLFAFGAEVNTQRLYSEW